MRRPLTVTLLVIAISFTSSRVANADDCGFDICPDVGLEDGSADVRYSGAAVGRLVAPNDEERVDYVWRLASLCVISGEAVDECSPSDFRRCPERIGRVIEYLVVQRRPVVRSDGTAVVPVPAGLKPGDLLGTWEDVGQGCLDITVLNPPPSPAEVFSYFQRLPLPELAARHQPPGNGLSGLPVIFYTDEPTTERFTVDIRGFEVVIDATATAFTWSTGDPAEPTIITDDPGAPYPDETITHEYASGRYTTGLTVTWSGTFTVDGSAPADIPGTTTTTGPPETFEVLQARPVLVSPS
jgi:hypothetical protein